LIDEALINVERQFEACNELNHAQKKTRKF